MKLCQELNLLPKTTWGVFDKNYESKNLPEERLFENLFQDQFVFVLNNIKLLNFILHF